MQRTCAPLMALWMLALAAPLLAHEAPPTPATPAENGPLTVAVLDFNADAAVGDGIGAQIGTAINAMLGAEEGFRLVERESLDKALKELELNLSGLTETSNAVQVGRLVGAKILVTGRAFPLGQNLLITAKIIGTETTLVDAVLVKGSPAELDTLVTDLTAKIAERIRTNGHNLVARSASGADPVPALRERLATRQLPVVAVVVPERHIGQAPVAPDPAVETELKLLLRQCGFEIIDTRQNDLADWARNIKDTDLEHWPRSLSGADVVVVGEAFSEFAGRIGNLNSASARAELNLIDRRTGRIVLADRATTRAVDLSENIAGRTALQKAGHELGLRLLQNLAETLPEKAADAAENP